MVLCLESKVSQHRVTTWTSKASQSLLIRLPSLCFELRIESFFVLSGLENPFFGNLENPVTDSYTNATYQSKPILFQGVPARDVRNELRLCYARLTPCHLLQFRPSFASVSVRCTNFQLLTHHLFYHREFKIIV